MSKSARVSPATVPPGSPPAPPKSPSSWCAGQFLLWKKWGDKNHGKTYKNLCIYGILWKNLCIYGHFWTFMDIYGHLWTFMDHDSMKSIEYGECWKMDGT
jgi:hypothetical protein